MAAVVVVTFNRWARLLAGAVAPESCKQSFLGLGPAAVIAAVLTLAAACMDAHAACRAADGQASSCRCSGVQGQVLGADAGESVCGAWPQPGQQVMSGAGGEGQQHSHMHGVNTRLLPRPAERLSLGRCV